MILVLDVFILIDSDVFNSNVILISFVLFFAPFLFLFLILWMLKFFLFFFLAAFVSPYAAVCLLVLIPWLLSFALCPSKLVCTFALVVLDFVAFVIVMEIGQWTRQKYFSFVWPSLPDQHITMDNAS